MKNRLVIGIDEAGYGPSMGPLIIAATVWRVPLETSIASLTDLLEPELRPIPRNRNENWISIGDSKKIMTGKNGWSSLCSGARWQLEHLWGHREDWWKHASQLAHSDWSRVHSIVWYQSLEEPLLVFETNEDDSIRSAQQRASSKLAHTGIELVAAKTRLIDEPYFNQQIELLGNKATLLSETSLDLAKELCLKYGKDSETIEIYCDKHGGRNRYQAILMNSFDNTWFTIHHESKTLSQYQADWNDRPVAIQFQVGGDSLIPSAAASVLAKWLRELCMVSLNAFWQSKTSKSLEPTAGYYVDAVRFSGEIDSVSESIGIPKQQWWRSK